MPGVTIHFGLEAENQDRAQSEKKCLVLKASCTAGDLWHRRLLIVSGAHCSLFACVFFSQTVHADEDRLF